MARKGSRVLRWLKRLGLGLACLVALTVVVGAGFELVARQHAKTAFTPPGRRVDVGGGRRMHLDCRGHGWPMVVFEAGLDTNGSLAWSAVHDRIAAVTRACAYDRAGIMWSDPKRTPQDADAVAADLHALLQAAHEQGPYVLVGHSLGGPYVMDFTRHYPGEVAGLVFVDASHPDQQARFKGTPLAGTDPIPWFFRLMAATTWTGWTRIPLGPPPHGVPAKAAAAAKAYTATSLSHALTEGDAISASLAEGGKLRTLGDRPLVVLTADKPYPAEILRALKMERAEADRLQAIWRDLQAEEAGWSSRSRHQRVPDATHYIQFDRPDVVIAAVEEVVSQVRADRAKLQTRTGK